MVLLLHLQEAIEVLKLNTGNPASFGFDMPESIHDALKEQIKKDIISLDPNFKDCGLEIDSLEISERRNVVTNSEI